MSINKFAFLSLICSLLLVKANAQDEKIFNKLNSLYTLDNYQECIKKANSYVTDGGKSSKDAYPYLYLSMCYFAIYQNLDHYDPQSYKDPLRKALGYAGRYMKRDKTQALKGESSDFLDQLHRATIKETAYMYKNSDWKNLQNLAREMIKDYPTDFPAQLVAGTYLDYAGVKSEGDKAINAAMDSLKKVPSIPDTILQGDYVKAFTLYTGYLMESKDTKKAKTVMQLAMNICPGSEELESMSAKLNGGEDAKSH